MKFLVTALPCQVQQEEARPKWKRAILNGTKNPTRFDWANSFIFRTRVGRRLSLSVLLQLFVWLLRKMQTHIGAQTRVTGNQLNNDSPNKMLPTKLHMAVEPKGSPSSMTNSRQRLPLPHVDFENWNYIMQCLVNKPRHTWLHKQTETRRKQHH